MHSVDLVLMENNIEIVLACCDFIASECRTNTLGIFPQGQMHPRTKPPGANNSMNILSQIFILLIICSL